MTNYTKGKDWEMAVAKVSRGALDKAAKRNTSSHRGVRRSDIYNELGLHIEAKDQANIKLKEWYKQARSAAALGKTPIVVWNMEGEMMATLRYSDLLNFLVEIADLEAKNQDLHKGWAVNPADEPDTFVDVDDMRVCRAGHLADTFGYCLQRDCKFSRTYKVKKERKK